MRCFTLFAVTFSFENPIHTIVPDLDLFSRSWKSLKKIVMIENIPLSSN